MAFSALDIGIGVLIFADYMILPDLTAMLILCIYVKILHLLDAASPPRPGSQRWQAYYRLTFILVVLFYLIFDIVFVIKNIPPNLFQLLGVSSNADRKTIEEAIVSNDHSRMDTEMLDILKDPLKMSAYQLFGPDVSSCRTCITLTDYLRKGKDISTQHSLFFGIPFVYSVFSLSRKSTAVSLACTSLIAIPLYLDFAFASIKDWPSFLVQICPSCVPYQFISFGRQLVVLLSLALNRILPAISPPRSSQDWSVEKMTASLFLSRASLFLESKIIDNAQDHRRYVYVVINSDDWELPWSTVDEFNKSTGISALYLFPSTCFTEYGPACFVELATRKSVKHLLHAESHQKDRDHAIAFMAVDTTDRRRILEESIKEQEEQESVPREVSTDGTIEITNTSTSGKEALQDSFLSLFLGLAVFSSLFIVFFKQP